MTRVGRVAVVCLLVFAGCSALSAAPQQAASRASLVKRGDEALAAGRFEDAIAAYTQALAGNSNQPDVQLHLGMAYFRAGQFQEALSRLYDAARLKPGSGPAHYWAAMASMFWAADDGGVSADFDRYLDKVVELDASLAGDVSHLRVWNLLMTRRYSAAQAEAAKFLSTVGWRDRSSTFVVLESVLAARGGRDAAAADRLLADCAAKCDQTAWPYPIVRYFRGELSAAAVLQQSDVEKQTEARTYVAMNRVLSGSPDAAMADLRWVADNGTRTYFEWAFAKVTLADLTRDAARRAAAQPSTPAPAEPAPSPQATPAATETFGGVGLGAEVADNALRIVQIVPNSPALRAGLNVGDQILKVDGRATAGRTWSDVTPWIRGPVGSKVTLRIQIAGTTRVFDVALTRETITAAVQPAPPQQQPAPSAPPPAQATLTPKTPTVPSSLPKPQPAQPSAPPKAPLNPPPAPGTTPAPKEPRTPIPLQTWNTFRLGVDVGALMLQTNVAGERAQHVAVTDKELDELSSALSSLANHIAETLMAVNLSPAQTFFKSVADDLKRHPLNRKELVATLAGEFQKAAAFILGAMEETGGAHKWYVVTGVHFGILADQLSHPPVEREALDVPLRQIAGDLKTAPADVPAELLQAMRDLPKIAAKINLKKEQELQALSLLAAVAPIQAMTANMVAQAMEPIPGLMLSDKGAIPELASLCMRARYLGQGAQRDLSPQFSGKILEGAREVCEDAIGALKENAYLVGRRSYLFYLAYMSYNAGQYSESVKAYEEFLEADDINVPATYHNLSLAYDKLNRRSDAVKAIKKAAELNSWYKDSVAYKTLVGGR